MDEKYIQDLYNGLGGEGVFGKYEDFSKLISEDDAYRKDVYNGLGGEEVFGKYEDYDALVKKKGDGALVSPTGSEAAPTPSKVDRDAEIRKLTAKAVAGDTLAKEGLERLQREKKSAQPFDEQIVDITAKADETAAYIPRNLPKVVKQDVGEFLETTPAYIRTQKPEIDVIRDNFGTRTAQVDFDKIVKEGKKTGQVAEPLEREFQNLEEDYLDYLEATNPELASANRNKLNALRGKETLMDAEKKWLLAFRNDAIEKRNLAAEAAMWEIKESADVKEWQRRSTEIGSQVAGLDRDIAALGVTPDSPPSVLEKAKGLINQRNALVAEYEALGEKTGFTPDKQEVYFGAAKQLIGAEPFMRGASTGMRFPELKAQQDEEKRIIEARKQTAEIPVIGQISGLYEGFQGVVRNMQSAMFKLPKVIGDALGDEDYDWVDEMYNLSTDFQSEMDVLYSNPFKEGDKVPTGYETARMLGEGVGSVGMFIAGGEVAALAQIPARVGVVGTAFLTGTSDYYEEAIAAGMNPKEAARTAIPMSAVSAMIEGIVPDAKYIAPSEFRRSVIRSLTSGKPFKEAMRDAIDALPDATRSYLDAALKEGVEEGVAQVGTDVAKEVSNAIQSNKFLDLWSEDAYKQSIMAGALTGGVLNVFSRPKSYQASPIQEEILGYSVENRDDIVSEFSSPAFTSVTTNINLDIIREAKEIKDGLNGTPSFQKLSVPVQNHVMAELLRKKKLEEGMKASGIRPESTLAEIAAIEAEVKSILDTGMTPTEASEARNKAAAEPEPAPVEIELEPTAAEAPTGIAVEVEAGRRPTGDGKFVRYNPDDVLPLLQGYSPTNTVVVEDYVNQVIPNDASVEAYKIVPIDAIQTSEKIESKDRKTIDKIKEGIKNGDDIPPLVLDFSPVIKNGEKYKFGLMDGHHRYIAYKELGIKKVPAAIVTSREHYTFETNDANIETLFEQPIKETPVTEPQTQADEATQRADTTPDGEVSMPGTGLEGGGEVAGVQPAVDVGADTGDAEATGVVELTEQEELDYAQQWDTVRGSVMEVDPNLSDAEADYAATMVQASNVSPEEAVRMAKENPDDVAAFMAEEAVEEAPMAEEAVTEGEVAADNVGKFLSDSGISVEVLDDADYKNTVSTLGGQQSESEGIFVADDKKVYINRDKIKNEWGKTIAYHEGTHPVINIIRNTNPALYKTIVSGIMDAAKTNPNVARVVNMVKNNPEYKKAGQAVIEDETVVEVLAQIAAGKLDFGTFEKTTREKIIDFMNTLAEFFGLPKIAMNSPRTEVQNLAKKLTDALNKQGSIADVVGKKRVGEFQNTIESLKTLSSPLNQPSKLVRPRKNIYGKKIKYKDGGYNLSLVKPEDIIDIESLVKKIADEKSVVWFWTADQLGRGYYSDETIEGEHYLDAGPSFALDKENRDEGVIWASGADEKTLKNRIEESDYIFIISGSPQQSKLFNKKVVDFLRKRTEKASGLSWSDFSKKVIDLTTKTTKAGKISKNEITNILEKYNSFEELLNSKGNDKKKLFVELEKQRNTTNTPLSQYLKSINLSFDVDALRDGFYKENGFGINDVMLVLKPTELGGKSTHSTYEYNIMGTVVGVPDKRVNGIDLLPEERRKKYSEAQRSAPMTGAAGSLKSTIQASKMDRNQIKFGFEPSKVFSGANEDIANASDQYKEENGLSQQTPSFILNVSENDAKRVADAYEKMKHDPDNPQVKQGFSELITEIKKQADVLLSMGYKFQLSKEGEGYGSDSKKMSDDVRKNKRIFVDPSSKSFGTKRTFDKDNIGLQDSGYKDANGVPMTNVELIRAVHDLFGHAEFGNGFGPIGEENAWRNHMSMFTPLAQKALTTTTRGQNSWVNFGPHMRNEDGSIKKSGDKGYLPSSQRPFAEQKIGFLPEWAMDNSYGDKATINGKSVKPVNKYVLEGTEMYEINDGNAFYEAIKAAKESRGADGIQVSLKSVEDYQNIVDNGGRLIVTKDGLAGLMVEADGNVGSGFAHADIPAGKNTLKPLLLMAIKLGARYTDAYDTYLPGYYAKFGFKPLNRIKFNEEFAEKGWEKTTLSSKPDVVVMYWDGGSRENVDKNYGKFAPYSKSQGDYTNDYDAAIESAKEKSLSIEPSASLVPPKIPMQASAMGGQRTEPVTIEGSPKGIFLNIGLLEGMTNRVIPVSEMLEKLPQGVTVIEAKEVQGTEPTVSVQLSRKLTDAEMDNLLADTKQMAIPQLANGEGVIHGTTDWGPFNPEYFILPNNKSLSSESSQRAAETAQAVETAPERVKVDALKDVESTAKALDEVKEFKAESDKYFEYVPIEEIEKYKEFDRSTEKKWGSVDTTLDELVDDIRENGIKTPITLQVDKDGNALVVEGNTRLAAAKKLGIKNIPVRVVSGEFGSVNKDKAKKIDKKRSVREMRVFYSQVNILDQENSAASFGFTSISGAKDAAQAYHAAKKDGSNPELVRAVEELLSGERLAKGQASAAMRREARPTVRKTSQGYQVISADGKPLSRPNLTEGQAKSMAEKIGRMAPAAPAVSEAISEIDTVLEQKGKNAAEARRSFKERYGQDAYDRAREVTLNFDKIINDLEQQGRVRKDCP